MKIKHIIIGLMIAMLFGIEFASAATITFRNDGLTGTSHYWSNTSNKGGSAYQAAISNPIGVNPLQKGANSGGYSSKAGWVKNFITDVWAITTDVNTTASFSIDYTNTLMSIASAVLYSNSARTIIVGTANAPHVLIVPPYGGLNISSLTFAPLSLSVGTTYYLAINGGTPNSYLSNALNSASYTISTPSSDSFNIPIPGAVWLFGTGIIGLIGFKARNNKVVLLPV